MFFTTDLRIAGVDFKAGQEVPDDIRDGVLQPLLRLGRVAEAIAEPEPEPSTEVEPEPESIEEPDEKPKRGRPRKS